MISSYPCLVTEWLEPFAEEHICSRLMSWYAWGYEKGEIFIGRATIFIYCCKLASAWNYYHNCRNMYFRTLYSSQVFIYQSDKFTFGAHLVACNSKIADYTANWGNVGLGDASSTLTVHIGGNFNIVTSHVVLVSLAVDLSLSKLIWWGWYV